MLTQIQKSGGGPQATGDITTALTDCHERIRHFTGLAMKLASCPQATASEVADAASRIDRYFTLSLPLHEQDEDTSLLPRLAQKMDEAGREALQQMTSEHGQINILVARIIALVRTIAADPTTLPELCMDLQSQTASLQQIWEKHLPLEEEVIFPQIEKLLDAETKTAIQVEMQTRRR